MKSMTEAQITEVTRLKLACIDAALKVERATVTAQHADWKFQDYCYGLMREELEIRKAAASSAKES